MNRILVIFDLDDTLIQTTAKIRAAERLFFDRHGLDYTDEERAAFAGVAFYAHLERLQVDYRRINGREAPGEFEAELVTMYAAAIADGIDLTDGAAEFLSWLQSSGVDFCIASNSTEESLPWKLELGGLGGIFGYDFGNAFSKDFVERPKPAPDVFLHAAQAMGYPPSSCIVIGDSPADMEAARMAGMLAIGFTGGAHRLPDAAKRLIAAGADRAASSMKEAQHIVSERLYAPQRKAAPEFSL